MQDERELLREVMRKRFTTLFFISIQVIALISVVIGAIFLLYSNPVKWDLTRNKRFSLAPKTIEVLHNLKEPVKAWAFFEKGSGDMEKARELLEEYRRNSKGKFSYEFVDITRNPELIERYKVRYLGEVVLEAEGEKPVHVNEVSEYQLTNALIKLFSGERKVLYFLQGHDEPSLLGGSSPYRSLSLLKKTLEDRGYTVRALNLAREGKIPDDASIVFIVNPRRDLSPQEVELLEDYLKKGGKLFLAIDLPERAMPNILKLLKDFGVKYDEGYVLSPLALRFGKYATIASISSAETKIKGVANAMIWLSLSRVLDISRDRPENVSVTPLLVADGIYKTPEEFQKELKEKLLNLTKPPKSYLVGVKVVVNVKPEEKSEKDKEKQPEKRQRKGMMIVVADGEFLSDIFLGPQYSSFLANVDFALGAVEAMLESSTSWKPNPKEFPTPRVLSKSELALLRLLSLGTPLLMLLIGAGVLIMRYSSKR